jgi:heparan-alpha-glucosaminide N-acetyltransferase
MYCMDHLFYDSIRSTIPIFLGKNIYSIFGALYAPATEMAMFLLVLWLACYWMYRRKIFLKV